MTAEEKEEYQKLVDNNEDAILSIVASALGGFVNDHESICLAKILQTNAFFLGRGHEPLGRYSIDESARTVAQLCSEYDTELLGKFKASHFLQIPLPERAAYWKRKLEAIREKDEPLAFADRNTLSRLTDKIAHEPRLFALKYLEKLPHEDR